MGYVLASVNVGITIAPTLGGILYEKAGYASIFIAIFALLAVDILMRLVMVERKVAIQWQEDLESDHQGLIPQYGTSQRDLSHHKRNERVSESSPLLEPEFEESELGDQPGDQRGDHSSHSAAASVNEPPQRPDDGDWKAPPIIILLGSPRILANLYGAVVGVTLLVSFDSSLPLFVERTFGWGSTGGGLIFLTVSIPVLSAPLAGKLSDLYDSRWISAVGFDFGGVFAALLLLVKHDGIPQMVLLRSFLTLYGPNS